MSLRRTLDAMALSVGRAKSVPLSASCWVNRAEMLSLIERARGELPAELDEATQILMAHQEVLDAAENEGEQVLEQARAKAAAMVEDTVIVASAQARADAILHAARTEATRLLRSADEYCDRRLGLFQADLEKTLGQVRNGRGRLQERSELDTFAEETGLADAADAVDNAAAQAQAQARRDEELRREAHEQAERDRRRAEVSEVHDQEAVDRDATPAEAPDVHDHRENGGDVPAETEGEHVGTDGYDLTDAVADAEETEQSSVPGQARPGDRVIDLREDAEPAGLGPGRTLQ